MKPSFAYSLLALALAPMLAHAQQAPTNAGALLQQMPSAPTQAPSHATLAAPLLDENISGDPTPIPVQRIRIVGNTAFTEDELHVLVERSEHQSLTLGQLQQLAGRITAYYRAHGYTFARAYVPAQELGEGDVKLRVLEAVVDDARIDDRSRISSHLLHAMLQPLQDKPLRMGQVNRQLLLIDDLPGSAVQSRVQPGTMVGSTQLAVDVADEARVFGNVGVDNAGNRYTGNVRVNANAALAEPLGYGDQLDASVLGAQHLGYLHLGYQSALNGRGTRAGIGGSYLDYALGGDLHALDAHGDATQAEIWLEQALWRAPDYNWSLRLQAQHRSLSDRIDTTGSDDARDIDSYAATLDGTWQQGRGVNHVALGVTRGRVDITNADARAADAGTARTQGDYSRWNLQLDRLQSVTERNRLWVSFAMQDTARNLDPAEQFLLGGADNVRGYDSGAVSGAEGWLATVEWRFAFAPQWQATAFVDGGSAKLDAQTWQGRTGPTRGDVNSGGLGLDWHNAQRWSASLRVAKAIGSDAMVPVPGVRAWLNVGKGF